jgi:hypothetical protein
MPKARRQIERFARGEETVKRSQEGFFVSLAMVFKYSKVATP